VQDREVRLTRTEFELFHYMARHPRRVLNYRTLLERIWGERAVEQMEYLRVYVGQLRKKLEPEPSRPRYLLTEYGVGYRLDPGVARCEQPLEFDPAAVGVSLTPADVPDRV
jgi:two-component system KDP operon response regulator KdpE